MTPTNVHQAIELLHLLRKVLLQLLLLDAELLLLLLLVQPELLLLPHQLPLQQAVPFEPGMATAEVAAVEVWAGRSLRCHRATRQFHCPHREESVDVAVMWVQV